MGVPLARVRERVPRRGRRGLPFTLPLGRAGEGSRFFVLVPPMLPWPSSAGGTSPCPLCSASVRRRDEQERDEGSGIVVMTKADRPASRQDGDRRRVPVVQNAEVVAASRSGRPPPPPSPPGWNPRRRGVVRRMG